MADLYSEKLSKVRFGATIPDFSKTSEKEYKQIQKKLTKVAHEERSKLKKIKEVDNFIRNDLSNVMCELKRARLDKNSSSMI